METAVRRSSQEAEWSWSLYLSLSLSFDEKDEAEEDDAKEDGDCGEKDFPRGSEGVTTLVGGGGGTRPRQHS